MFGRLALLSVLSVSASLVCFAPVVAAADNEVTGENAAKDAEYRRLLIGTWQDSYQGVRTMIVRTNGTATMVVELRGWKAALYAKRLQFEMVWSVENGGFHKRTVGGEPAGKVNMILKMMGDRVEERILELTAKQLLLLDQNGKRQYDWRRVEK